MDAFRVRSPMARCAAGAALAVSATILQVAIDGFYPDYAAPYLLYVGAVYVASMVAGHCGGWSATLISAVLIPTVVYPPPFTVPPSLLGLTLFVAVCYGIIRTNTRLVRTLALREQVLSMASHDFKTPLGAIQLEAGLLERAAMTAATERPLDAARVAQAAQRIQRGVQRMTLLVANLLDAARLRAGHFAIEPAEADLATIVRDLVDQCAPSAARVGSEIRVAGADVPHPGVWDAPRLGQVVANLLSNAIKYGEGRPIEVTLQEGAGRTRLAVRDHGRGIPAEAQRGLFEPFSRASDDRDAFASHGLGLWVVREIVASHGGSISVESAPGHGATFVVDLPHAAPQRRIRQRAARVRRPRVVH